MHIEKVIVKNYRCLKNVEIDLNNELNIIVGNNETGKSTILEAINLALTGQLNGRSIHYELHPFLFNNQVTRAYLEALQSGSMPALPEVLIEVYLNVEPDPPHLQGSINSLREDTAGVYMRIEFDQTYKSEYAEYMSDPNRVKNIPIEYYQPVWRSFANDAITSRSIPIKPRLIDSSRVHNTLGANRYVVDIVRDGLTKQDLANVSLSYRNLKDAFANDPTICQINEMLANKAGEITQKELSVALDTLSKSGWDAGIAPHLDEIPLPLAGSGEHSTIKIKLALVLADERSVFLLEEPENHLSHSNLNVLLANMQDKTRGKQLIIVTHSSFVLNKLGIGDILVFDGENVPRLTELSAGTQDFFMRLPGYDTLRMILAKRAILVEGRTDELIVQRAYKNIHGELPLACGVDVISVGTASLRFLEIAEKLKIPIAVVADNDGSADAVRQKYREFSELDNINIYYDSDEQSHTLEPQLLKANNLETLNKALDKSFTTEIELLDYMSGHKADCALRMFNTDVDFQIPEYIQNAVSQE